MKSHLFPRSLVRRIKGNEKHVTAGDRMKKGVSLLQSGRYDFILCDNHEQMLGRFDDYAVRFCRDYVKEGKRTPSGKAIEIPNPNPNLLQSFAYACVWREAVSKDGIRHGLTLGPYREKIEKHLFEGEPANFLVTISKPNIVGPDGAAIEIGLSPYQRRFLGANVYHFQIGGLDFMVKLDQRKYEIRLEWEKISVSNNPVLCVELDKQSLENIPMLRKLFTNMLARR